MNRVWRDTCPGPVEPAHLSETLPRRSMRCLICPGRTPRPVRVGQVCGSHHERLGLLLDPSQRGQMHTKPGEPRVPPSIPVLWSLLDATPGATGLRGAGRAPGFGSSPPLRLDVLVARDRRSVPDDDADPWSVLGTLVAIARRLEPDPGPWQAWTVEGASAWLYARLDALCAQEWVADAWTDLRTLSGQLRAATGDPAPRPVGICRQPVDQDGQPAPDSPLRCGTPVYRLEPPLRGDDEPAPVLPPPVCGGCGHVYGPRAVAAELARVAAEHGQVSA